MSISSKREARHRCRGRFPGFELGNGPTSSPLRWVRPRWRPTPNAINPFCCGTD